jgi:hypothetical protein
MEVPMLDKDSEFRQALAKATKAARDTAITPSIPPDMTIRDLGDREWLWIISAAIFAWTDAQRDSMRNGYDGVDGILPKLGELPLDWNKPLKDWSKEEIVGFITKAIGLVIKHDLSTPPFFNRSEGATADAPFNDTIPY